LTSFAFPKGKIQNLELLRITKDYGDTANGMRQISTVFFRYNQSVRVWQFAVGPSSTFALAAVNQVVRTHSRGAMKKHRNKIYRTFAVCSPKIFVFFKVSKPNNERFCCCSLHFTVMTTFRFTCSTQTWSEECYESIKATDTHL